jgi:hypothetical protein
LSDIALALRDQVAALAAPALIEQMRWLAAQQALGRMEQVTLNVNVFGNDFVWSSILTGAGYKEVDFGTGGPIWTTAPMMPIPWTFQATPSAAGDGGFDLHAQLPVDCLDRLETAEWQRILHPYR